ncbi:hypothetical protein SGI37_20590, partial [Providencia rettgeri]
LFPLICTLLLSTSDPLGFPLCSLLLSLAAIGLVVLAADASLLLLVLLLLPFEFSITGPTING